MKKLLLLFAALGTMRAVADVTNSTITVKSLLGRGFAIPLMVEGHLAKGTNSLYKGESITCINVRLVDNGIVARELIPVDFFTKDIQDTIADAEDGAAIKVLGYESLKVEGFPAAVGMSVDLLPQCTEWSVLPYFAIVKILEIGKKCKLTNSCVSFAISNLESSSNKLNQSHSSTNSGLQR